MSKLAVLPLVVILAVSNLLVVVPVIASASLPKPSVPEFTLKYVDNSYDVPPMTTSSIDPYTGKATTSTVSGYHVENKSVQITITNQPFTSYKDENGSNVNLYYDIRSKGRFEENLHNANPSIDSYYLSISNVPTTMISKSFSNLSDGSQIDYQVRTLIGKFVRVYGTPVPPFGTPYNDVFFGVGEASDWSSTQKVTIGENLLFSTNPTSVQIAIVIGVLVVIAAVIGAVAMVYWKKRKG